MAEASKGAGKGSGWARIREALRRDWARTRADLSGHWAEGAHPDAKDTVQQALGRRSPPATFEQHEPALRFGYEARQSYGGDIESWDEGLEHRLKREWDELKTGRTWEETREFVREGWEAGWSEGQLTGEPPVGRQDEGHKAKVLPTH